LGVDTNRYDHEFVRGNAKQPAEDFGQKSADDNNPVDAWVEQRPRGAPPGDA
jgi:hypothetical protein